MISPSSSPKPTKVPSAKAQTRQTKDKDWKTPSPSLGLATLIHQQGNHVVHLEIPVTFLTFLLLFR